MNWGQQNGNQPRHYYAQKVKFYPKIDIPKSSYKDSLGNNKDTLAFYKNNIIIEIANIFYVGKKQLYG